MVQGGMSVVKFLLFAFNFVFVACGIALIVVGAIAQTSGQEYTYFLNSKYVTAPTIIITLGCIIFFIAFLGCCGAMRQNYCMVMTFGVLLFLIFIIEIAGGITAYVYRSEIDKMIEQNLNKTLHEDKTDGRKFFDEVEQKLHCCGVKGPDDYNFPNGTAVYPQSCCGGKVEKCDDPYKKGCHKELVDYLSGKIGMVGGAAIGIAFIEILGMIFAWCLASAIKKEYEGV